MRKPNKSVQRLHTHAKLWKRNWNTLLLYNVTNRTHKEKINNCNIAEMVWQYVLLLLHHVDVYWHKCVTLIPCAEQSMASSSLFYLNTEKCHSKSRLAICSDRGIFLSADSSWICSKDQIQCESSHYHPEITKEFFFRIIVFNEEVVKNQTLKLDCAKSPVQRIEILVYLLLKDGFFIYY